jgi:hypothetical protein
MFAIEVPTNSLNFTSLLNLVFQFKFPEYSTEEILTALEIDGELPYPYLVALPYLVAAKVLLIDSNDILTSLHVCSVQLILLCFQ